MAPLIDSALQCSSESLPDEPQPSICSRRGLTRKRTVSFDSVHVHEHEVILGDNPSVSSGLPVALGERSYSEVMDVEEYEEYERRGRAARILTKQELSKMIRATHNLFVIFKAKRELKRIRKSREESFQQQQNEDKENMSKRQVKVI